MNNHIPPNFQVLRFYGFGDGSGDKEESDEGFGLSLFRGSCGGCRGLHYQQGESCARIGFHGAGKIGEGPRRPDEFGVRQCLYRQEGDHGCPATHPFDRFFFENRTGKCAPGLYRGNRKTVTLEVMEKGIPNLVASLSPSGLGDAALAIMTTDTVPKAVIIRGEINGKEVTLAGMAKGAGMISPRMATLLVFVLTDAAISPGALRKALREGVQGSFNRITVDGDMSTNDTLLVLANGMAGNREITPANRRDIRNFPILLNDLLYSLARKVAQRWRGGNQAG